MLLGGIDHRLSNWYPTCVESPQDPATEDPFPAFRDFCLENRNELRKLISTRRVATNAVGRSAILYPVFSRIAAREREPLALLELGASAGLNLRWDQYRYLYNDHSCGAADSAVVIESTIRKGDPPLPDQSPEVTYRHGVDLNPLDPRDSEDARWLRALIVPEHRDRYRRLMAALNAGRDDPPCVETGDATEVLPDLLEQFPEQVVPCVFSTHVRYQLSENERSVIDKSCRDWSRSGCLHLMYTDNSADCPGSGYRHATFRDGEQVRSELISAYESYGRWIEWYGES